jgi:hypothetical protein
VRDESWHTFRCPAGCPEDLLTIMKLHHRRLFFCRCEACHRLWLEGPEGEALFSHREVAALLTVRKRVMGGQLVP